MAIRRPSRASTDPMTRRLRLVGTAVLIGAAILLMHVEAGAMTLDVGAAAVGHQQVDHNADHNADHNDGHGSGDDCTGDCDADHGRHTMAACSMVLVALGGLALLAATRRHQSAARPPDRTPLPRPTLRRQSPERPPDLAALAVMRC